jgi:hypothetical protein
MRSAFSWQRMVALAPLTGLAEGKDNPFYV